jgi:hypothetical protein
LSEWKGVIPGLREQIVDEDGTILYQAMRSTQETKCQEKRITVKQYCSLLRKDMYGGMEEIQLIVQMYKVQVFVYSVAAGTKSHDLVPFPILMNNDLSPDHEENAGNTLSQLLARKSFLITSFRSENSLAFGVWKNRCR